VQGIAMPFFFISMVTILLDGLPARQIPAATGISNFLRITAAAFATSIATTTWDNRATLHQSRLAESSSLYDPALLEAVGRARGLGLDSQQSLGALTRTMVEQSYLLSSLDYFWLSAWLSLAMIGLVWWTHRPTGGQAAAAID